MLGQSFPRERTFDAAYQKYVTAGNEGKKSKRLCTAKAEAPEVRSVVACHQGWSGGSPMSDALTADLSNALHYSTVHDGRQSLKFLTSGFLPKILELIVVVCARPCLFQDCLRARHVLIPPPLLSLSGWLRLFVCGKCKDPRPLSINTLHFGADAAGFSSTQCLALPICHPARPSASPVSLPKQTPTTFAFAVVRISSSVVPHGSILSFVARLAPLPRWPVSASCLAHVSILCVGQSNKQQPY